MEARLRTDLPQVTERQLEVARLVAQGLDNPAIAEELGVSLAGAKYHVSELLSRLNLTTRTEIATWYHARDNRGLLHRFAFAPVGLAITATAGAVAVGAAVIAISFGSAGGTSDAPALAVATEAATEVAAVVVTGDGAFLPVADPGFAPRLYPSATTLDDGRVLLAGGSGSAQRTPAEIYDPTTGVFQPAGSLLTPRTSHATVLLDDGRVLLTGGVSSGPPILKSAEVWDPTTSEFTRAASMNVRRMSHAAVTLADGRVLISGGGFIELNDEGRLPDPITTAEIYDPATDAFAPTGSMNVARRDHHLTLLADGRALVSGGGPLELYDPTTGEFTLFGGEPVFGSEATVATVLADGRVLITGVSAEPADYESTHNGTSTRGAYIVDTASGAVVPVASMRLGRERFHTGTLLPDGRVLIAGGVGGYGAGDGVIRYPPSEIFDPVTGTFEPVSHKTDPTVPGGLRATNMAAHRPGHTANPLPDGTVLLIGYFADENFTWTVERFDPLAAGGEDPFGDFIVKLESKPPKPPGDVVDASSPPMFTGSGDPFGFTDLTMVVAERGLQLRELPAGSGICVDGLVGLGAQGLRAERTDGTAALDFYFYVYSSADALSGSWATGEDGRVAPRLETDCDKAFGGEGKFPSAIGVFLNDNLLLMLTSVGPDYREANPTTRTLLIEAFEAIGTTEE